MVSRILVDGFKSIDRAELDLGMFTLLSGVNSAGSHRLFRHFYIWSRCRSSTLKRKQTVNM